MNKSVKKKKIKERPGMAEQAFNSIPQEGKAG